MVVDDHRYLDEKVRNGLMSQVENWDLEIVGSEREALNLLSLRPCDVLIAGMNGIDASGAGTMARLSVESPSSIRIALAVPGDVKPSGFNHAHRILPNPITGDRLSAAINGAITLKSRLTRGGLANFLANADILPVPNETDLDILEELAEAAPNATRLADLIQTVPDYARQFARLAALHDGAYDADLVSAIEILGPDVVRAVVVFESVHRQLPLDRLRRTGLANMKSHGYEMAHVARRIAGGSTGGGFATMAFVGGLLHDLGSLTLAANRVSDYRRVLKSALREDRPLLEAERKQLGVTHSDVGTYLMGLWGIPDAQAALLDDHGTTAEGDDRPAAAMRLANLILGDPGEPRGAIEMRYGRAVKEFDAFALDAKQVRELAGIRFCD